MVKFNYPPITLRHFYVKFKMSYVKTNSLPHCVQLYFKNMEKIGLIINFFRYYMAALLVIPTIFYLPKFFEYDSVTTTKSFRYSDPCDDGNLTDCVYDPDYENGTTLVRHKYTEYNFTELKFSSLRENYYYRRVSTNTFRYKIGYIVHS